LFVRLAQSFFSTGNSGENYDRWILLGLRWDMQSILMLSEKV